MATKAHITYQIPGRTASRKSAMKPGLSFIGVLYLYTRAMKMMMSTMNMLVSAPTVAASVGAIDLPAANRITNQTIAKAKGIH